LVSYPLKAMCHIYHHTPLTCNSNAYLFAKVRISPEHVVKWVMPRTPPPDEIRLKAIGVTRLEPGQATYAPRVRAKREVLERFLSLNTRQRGEVVEAGLRALGLWGVKDA